VIVVQFFNDLFVVFQIITTNQVKSLISQSKINALDTPGAGLTIVWLNIFFLSFLNCIVLYICMLSGLLFGYVKLFLVFLSKVRVFIQ